MKLPRSRKYKVCGERFKPNTLYEWWCSDKHKADSAILGQVGTFRTAPPLMMPKESGGWEKLEMVNKYAHLSDEHLKRFSGIVLFLAHDGLPEKTHQQHL